MNTNEPITITPLSQVETDAFCDCGYNLHGQPVWRDERLDFLVCRCPECGRHAAAGRFTGIHSAWLHRLSLGLILTWIVALLGVFLFLTFMLGVWPGAYTDSYITIRPVPNTGPNATQYMYDLRDRSYWDQRNGVVFFVTMYGLAVVNGLLIGGIAASCMWHLRLRIFLVMLLPGLAVGFVVFIWANSGYEMTGAAQLWLYGNLAGFLLVECGAVFAGIVLGRPVARFMLRLLLPDRLLQHLAFLWYRDDKVMNFLPKE